MIIFMDLQEKLFSAKFRKLHLMYGNSGRILRDQRQHMTVCLNGSFAFQLIFLYINLTFDVNFL